MTEGKFVEGLRQVNALLHCIPFTVVDSRREVDELKELLTIARWVLLGYWGVSGALRGWWA